MPPCAYHRSPVPAPYSEGRGKEVATSTEKKSGDAKMADSIWPAGSTLSPLNVGWTSGNGRAILRLQEDKNLVLYKDHKVVYPFPNALGRGHHATMQTDGNFVLYDHNDGPVWDSDTDGHPGAYLAIQDDGNMVVYDKNHHRLWATDTAD